jgi:hypothetical protein
MRVIPSFWSDQLDGFDFDYNLIFDGQIGSEIRFEKPIPANLGQASYECEKRRRQSP